jgi:hypothetical protein
MMVAVAVVAVLLYIWVMIENTIGVTQLGLWGI